MKLLPPPTYKNRSQFSNNQDKAYNLSVAVYPSWVSTKDDKRKFIMEIQGGYSPIQWGRKNLKQLLKNLNNWKTVMSGHLMNLGFLDNKQYPTLNNSLEIKNDFIFFDFDNKGLSQGNLQYLSYEKALEILEVSGYNYVLSTSHSHLDSMSNVDKLHILIPVLKTITSADEYKSYRLAIHQSLFSNYPVDENASSNVNNKNGANIANARCNVEFSRNDFDLDIDLNTIRTLKQTSQIKKRSSAPQTSTIRTSIELYGHQVNKMFGFSLAPTSTSKSIHFFRNTNDKGAGVFNAPYADGYDPHLIFDNNAKDNGKRKEFSTFFTLDDFVKRERAKNIRVKVQDRITTLAEEFFDGQHQHMYIIANEGAGKSFSVLTLGSFYDFIYVCHTKDKVAETALSLKELGITCKIVLSIEEILKEHDYEHLIPKYKAYAKRVDKPSFSEFVSLNQLPKRLLVAYNNNNKQVQDNCIVLMTSAKLKVMMTINQGGIFGDKKPIVFDEFLVNEWYRRSLIDVQPPLYESTIDSTWNGATNRNFYVCKEDSFFELLEHKSVMILTTEKRLISTVMYGSDYLEYTSLISNWKMGKLSELSKDTKMNYDSEPIEFMLEADNVQYLLLKSTRKDIIGEQIQTIQAEKEGLSIISNGVKGKIDGVLTHMGIKGMNNLSDNDTLIFGTLKNELQIKEFALNNQSYFLKMFKKEITQQVKAFKNTKTSDQEILKDYMQGLIFQYSEPIIQDILLETEVSQSIGRNSGFRDKGSSCVVVLPIIQNNTYRRIARPLKLNYVSKNVAVLEYNQDTNKFRAVS